MAVLTISSGVVVVDDFVIKWFQRHTGERWSQCGFVVVGIKWWWWWYYGLVDVASC